MDCIMLILTIIGTIATVVSTIIAINAKNQAEDILNEIRNNNISNNGHINIKSKGNNHGVIAGINTGDINNEKK